MVFYAACLVALGPTLGKLLGAEGSAFSVAAVVCTSDGVVTLPVGDVQGFSFDRSREPLQEHHSGDGCPLCGLPPIPAPVFFAPPVYAGSAAVLVGKPVTVTVVGDFWSVPPARAPPFMA